MEDIARKFKTTTVGADGKEKSIKLYIKTPSKKVIRDAEFQYGKSWSKAMREGFFTEEEAVKMLVDRGIVNDEYTETLTNVQKEIVDLSEKLSETTDDEEGYKISVHLRALRITYFNLLSRENDIMRNTAENYARDIRDAFIAAKCTYVDSVQPHPFFKSFDDLQDRIDDQATQDAIINSVYVIYGTDSPTESYLENVWLKKHDLLGEDGEILEFNKEEEKPKPKTKAKKTTKKKKATKSV